MEDSRIARTLDSLSKAIESDPAKGPATYAAATAKVLNGLKCRVTGPGGEQLETDMPKSMGAKARRRIPAGFSGRLPGGMLLDNDHFACRAAGN